MSQARFISSDLHTLLDELFQSDALGHLRRAQGLIREARKEIEELGHEQGRKHLARAITQMKRFEKVRVPLMRELLNRFRIEKTSDERIREIERSPSNPLLRYNQQETLENVLNANQKSHAGSETPGNATFS